MQDLAEEEQKRQEALRNGVLKVTPVSFDYERKSAIGAYADVGAEMYEGGIILTCADEFEPGHVSLLPDEARLLTAWLIERGYGPKGGAA